jgi:hypothetical protein
MDVERAEGPIWPDEGRIRGMSHSALVTWGLCFYNPHITARKAGPAKGHPGIQPLANLSSSWQTVPVLVLMIWLRFFESPRSIE